MLLRLSFGCNMGLQHGRIKNGKLISYPPSPMTRDHRDPAAPLLPYEAELAAGLPRAKERVKRLIAWSSLPLGSVIRVDTGEPAIALTFDDGPHPVETPRVLELLERHGARGTFFMVGKSARRHPEIVARAAAAGHAVANHSWDHPSFRRIRGSYRRAQIPWCGAA